MPDTMWVDKLINLAGNLNFRENEKFKLKGPRWPSWKTNEVIFR